MELSLILAITLLVHPVQEASNAEKIRQIAEQFDKNRESFSYGRYRFEFIRGRSDWDDAKKGEIPDNAAIGNGLYIFNGDHWRLEVLYEPDVLLARSRVMGGNVVQSDIQAFRALTDGRKTFYHLISPEWKPGVATNTVQIDAGSERFFSSFPLPLDLGRPKPLEFSFSAMLERGLTADYQITSVDWNGEFDSRPVVVVTLSSEKDEHICWIDVERGAIPLLIETRVKEPELVSRQYHHDLRFLPKAGWIPFRTTISAQPHGIVVHTRLLECDLSRVPSRSDFELAFDEPIGVIDVADARKYEPRTSWSLFNLPTTPQTGAQAIQILGPRSLDNAMPGERPAGWPWWVPTLIGLGVVLLILFLTQKFWRQGYAA